MTNTYRPQTQSRQERAQMRRGKFNAKPTVVDNVKFASKREALYYMQLKALQKAGSITDLELQPRFPMPPDGMWATVKGQKEMVKVKPGTICTYVTDFRYKNKAGETVVVDVKGYKTREYILKKKLLKYFYSIEVIEA